MQKTNLHLFIPLLFLLISLSSCSLNDFNEKEIVFKNSFDGTELAGTLTLPDPTGKVPAVLLVHGSGPHNRNLEFMDNKKLFKDLAEYLTTNGIAVLRYDKRGVGMSTGQFLPYDMENFKNDAIAGIKYLKTVGQIDTSKIGVIGISQGGLVVQMMAAQSPDINFAVMLGSPGIWGKDFIYSTQKEITKAAGFKEEDIKDMTVIFDQLWPFLEKDQLTADEVYRGKLLLKRLWNYIDNESRKDFGFVDEAIDFWFNLYRSETLRNFYNYDPSKNLQRITCPVLAITGDKDVQAPSKENLPVIESALKRGKCNNFEIIELKNHNHIFQQCTTGKISEYKTINGTMSDESLEIIKDWILKTTGSRN